MKSVMHAMPFLIALLVATAAAHAQPAVTLTHVHGFAYSPDCRRLMIPSHHGLAVFFDLDGKRLWYSAFDGQPRLAHVPLGGGAATQVTLPPLPDDAVAYIAQNPAARSEYAIASFGKSIYVSKDAGRSWSQIADRGKTK